MGGVFGDRFELAFAGTRDYCATARSGANQRAGLLMVDAFAFGGA
jgi:hypothetical protein